MKKFLKLSIIKFLIVMIIIGLDLVTKHFFYQSNLTIIPYLIGFRVVSGLNTGGAWSIFSSGTTMLIVFTIIIILGLIAFDIYLKKINIVYSLSISFLLGGAIGNLIDRIALGGVRDFIYFPFMPSFPTYNLADSFIFIGSVLLFIYVIFLFKPKNSKTETLNSSQETESVKLNTDINSNSSKDLKQSYDNQKLTNKNRVNKYDADQNKTSNSKTKDI